MRILEYPLLQINPSVTSIVNGSGSLIRYFSLSSLFSGLGSAAVSASNAAVRGRSNEVGVNERVEFIKEVKKSSKKET